MTSAAPTPPSQLASQQQQRANASNPPSTPVAAPIHSAVSPPNKRDLKSWWKGFKIPSKHQEQHGTAAPSIIPFPRSDPQRTATIFEEDMDGSLKQLPPAVVLLRNMVSDKEKHAVHQQASASMSPPPTTKPRGLPKLSTLACVVAWRFRRPRREPGRSHPVRTKLTVTEHRPQGIFGVPLRQSITYANVAISLVDEDGKSYIYGYVPIVVAKCGVFLKERGAYNISTWSSRRALDEC
jgi:hypothetical protein